MWNLVWVMTTHAHVDYMYLFMTPAVFSAGILCGGRRDWFPKLRDLGQNQWDNSKSNFISLERTEVYHLIRCKPVLLSFCFEYHLVHVRQFTHQPVSSVSVSCLCLTKIYHCSIHFTVDFDWWREYNRKKQSNKLMLVQSFQCWFLLAYACSWLTVGDGEVHPGAVLSECGWHFIYLLSRTVCNTVRTVTWPLPPPASYWNKCHCSLFCSRLNDVLIILILLSPQVFSGRTTPVCWRR